MVHTGLRLSPKWIVHCGNIAMSGCQSCGCGDAVTEVVQRTSSETQTRAVMCVSPCAGEGRSLREAAFRDVIIGKRPQAICRATNSAVDDSIGGS